MSMTIGTTPGVNELQLQAMLTGQLKEATRLDGWEAFKNFFIKLLNHLPGMNLEDKEKNLREIYNSIYGKKTADASAKTHSIETLWPAVENLIQLMEGEHVRTMEFELKDFNISGLTDQFQKPEHINLVIRVNDHTLPEIALTNSDMHHEMLTNVITHNMINKDGEHEVYLLDPNKLHFEDNRVKLVFSAVEATRHCFELHRALEASRELVNTPVKETSNVNEQLEQLEQLQHYQQQITELTQLYPVQDLFFKSIDNTLQKLENYRQQLLESYQKTNHEFVESFVEECANGLVQGGFLSKEGINTKLSHLSALTTHRDALFRYVDSKILQNIQSQLELASQVADLQEQIQSSENFPQESFSSLQGAMRQAEKGPLTTLLNTAFNAIRKFSPLNIAKGKIEAQTLQASGELLKSLAKEEANMANLLSRPDIRSDMDSKTTEGVLTQVTHLPTYTPDKTTLSSRAETLHHQNVAIIGIDRLLSEGLNLAKEDVLNYPREKVISELQTLNAQLPESHRKSSYQLQIDELNVDLLRCKVDVWEERIGSTPEAGRSAASENAVQALTVLKSGVNKLNIPEEIKRIDDMIMQEQLMVSVETKLLPYSDGNTYALKEVVSLLYKEMSKIGDCPRKQRLKANIDALKAKNDLLDAINNKLIDVDNVITQVVEYQTIWSEELARKLNDLEIQAQDLPKTTSNLLAQKIAVIQNKLTEIRKLENKFLKMEKMVATATETNDLPSQSWTKVFPLLRDAVAVLKNAPEGPRKRGLQNRLGEIMNKALQQLERMIIADPQQDRKYMKEIKNNLKQLQKLINSHQFDPFQKQLLTTAVKYTKDNNFPSSGFLNRLTGHSRNLNA